MKTRRVRAFIFMRLALLTAVMAVWTSPAAAQWAQAPPREVVITGGWLFDGVGDARVRNTGIVIRDGKFVEVGADLSGRYFPAARMIELDDGATILPGMIDLHGHLNMNMVGVGRAEEVTYNSIIFLANGVTATWSAGEFFPERVIEARDRIDRGEAIGTRLFASGPYFGAFRCEYQIKTAEDDCIAWPNDITEQEIRAEVDYWAQRGVRSIKIKQATPEEMRILIDQAHRRGMTTTSHLGNYAGSYDVEPDEAIAMGLDRIEHRITSGRGDDPAELERMINLFLEEGVYLDSNLQMYSRYDGDPTGYPSLDLVWADEYEFFTPYAQQRIRARKAASGAEPGSEHVVSRSSRRHIAELGALFESGGGDLIIVGTDEPTSGPWLPGFAYHRELMIMVSAGLPPAAVLKAATINGARALGVVDRLGSIETGKLADLYVAEGNPLEDISTARNVRLVVKAGVVYDPAELLEMAKGKIGPSGPDDHAAWELAVKPLRRR